MSAKIVFLDRDGTINKCIQHNNGLITKESELELIPGAAEGIAMLNKTGFRTIIVTNQPQVAKGLCTEDDIRRINTRLVSMLKEKGARIDAAYYCPHHPDAGFPGERPEYKIKCDCRKPGIGMLECGAKEFNADLRSCYFAGDHARDMKAAENAGVKGIFVRTGDPEPPYENKRYPSKPFVELSDLVEAANFIIAYETGMQGMKAVIIAGGLGKRLAPLTENVPKPMLPVKGKPVLEHQLDYFKSQGIKDFVICTGHLSHKIESYFGDGSKFGVSIRYSTEESELGTGGALKNAEKLLGKKTFVMIYGDLLAGLDLRRIISFHKAKGGKGTLTLHKSDHPYDSDMVELDSNARITRFLGKPKSGDKFVNLGNAGLYCFEPAILKYFPTGKSMLDKEALPMVISRGEAIYGFVTSEPIDDMGTHERYVRHRD